jgi:WD40 repeat protein
MWETAAGKQVRAIQTGGLHGLAFSPNGARLASASVDGSVALWNVATGNRAGELRGGHRDGCICVAFSPDGALLAAAGAEFDKKAKPVRLWTMPGGSMLGTLDVAAGGSVTDVAFSPTEPLLATAGGGTLRLWQ